MSELTLEFYGVMAYGIEYEGKRVLIDPFIVGHSGTTVALDDIPAPDVILVTHAAFDHLGNTVEIAKRTGCPVVGGSAVRALLLDQGLPSEQVRATVWGIRIQLGDILIAPVPNFHWSAAQLSSGATVSGWPLAYVVTIGDGPSVYHSGDSAVSLEMELIGRLHQPDVAIVGCAQPREFLPDMPGPGTIVTGEMSPSEAALAARMLGARHVLASHYVKKDNSDVTEFLAAVENDRESRAKTVMALSVGETLVVDGDRAFVKPAVGGSGGQA